MKRLLDLAIKVNKETKSTVFVSYSGHINSIDIRIDINGWCGSDALRLLYQDYLSNIHTPPLSYGEWEQEYHKRINLIFDEDNKEEYNKAIKYLEGLL